MCVFPPMLHPKTVHILKGNRFGMNNLQKSHLRFLCFDKIMIRSNKVYFHHPNDMKIIQDFLKSNHFHASERIVNGGEYGYYIKFEK